MNLCIIHIEELQAYSFILVFFQDCQSPTADISLKTGIYPELPSREVKLCNIKGRDLTPA